MLRLIVLALLATLLVAACTNSPPASDRLGGIGEELVPAGSELLETREGSCPQIAGNPPCARLFFTSSLPEEERADRLEDSARAAGWAIVSREPRADGTLIELAREGFRAFAAIWEDDRALPCHEDPDTNCADELQVIEGE